MSIRTFTGVSPNGRLEEALGIAIADAKQSLHTDLILWQLVDVSGENGGFVLKNDLTVRIKARSMSQPASSRKKPPVRRKR